ncbi:glycosyl transferase 4-like domain protein [Bordetella holmesii 41130]|nr:glycosyl transferase 4-like domain protein [Bordetella holmesii 41130]
MAVDLAGHWAAAGREVMILTQAEGDAYPVPAGVHRRVLGTDGQGGDGLRGILDNLRRVRALRAVIREFKPDIVLGMMTTSSILAVLAAWGLPVKVIATEHTHPPSQQLSGMWQRLRRLTYPRAARVVALTGGTAQWIDRHVPGSRLAVIPNPVHWPLPRSEPRLAPPAALAGIICWPSAGCIRIRDSMCWSRPSPVLPAASPTGICLFWARAMSAPA